MEKVRAFHVAWMNQMEQHRCKWADDDHKLKMRRALVWHAIMNSKGTSTVTLMGAGKKTGSTAKFYNALPQLQAKTCKTFNCNRCFKGHQHPEWQHVCSFCHKKDLSLERTLL